MPVSPWILWCQKQLADLSLQLYHMGYRPDRIELLLSKNAKFSERFSNLMDDMNQVMNSMEENPDGHHHSEDFDKSKVDLVKWARDHKREFLGVGET